MAYTKYSLTPADNNAAPPNGAPEGMLPSAVNDTMRDMMAQIRDVGDGIRGGTYTMTAPVITGGSITGVALSGNTLTNPVISGGSINNTPIGASTANTGAFTTLSATGVTTVQAGTVSAPAITTTGDTNTGIFFPTADTIAFSEGGVESMRIDSSGQVGIGTSSPTNGKLHVVGDAVISTSDINGSTGTLRVSSLADSTLNTAGIVFSAYDASNALTNGTIHVVPVANYRSNFVSTYMADGAGGNYIINQFIPSSSSTSERMRIDSSGNVGIGGIPLSDTRLLVSNGGAVGMEFSPNIAIANENRLLSFNRGTSAYAAMNYDASIQKFLTGSTERMRIDSSGNLLLAGTATPATGVGTLAIFNGTAPTASVTNGIVLYAEDVSSSSELKVRDEAGNVTTLSPHNFSMIPEGASEDMAWAHYSERNGKRINVDMLKLARMVEKLTGEKLVYTEEN